MTHDNDIVDWFFRSPPRPENGIQLFSDSQDHTASAIIGGTDSEWNLYCDGYKRAADAVVDFFLERRTRLGDCSAYHASLAYAAIFLYRQYLELRLKDLFVLNGLLLDKSTRYRRDHGLIKLWRRTRKRIDGVSQIDDAEITEDMNRLEEIVQQFHDFDPGAVLCRYPVDEEGNASLPRIEIDMAQLKATMEWVAFCLDGINCGTWEFLSAKWEERAAMAQCHDE